MPQTNPDRPLYRLKPEERERFILDRVIGQLGNATVRYSALRVALLRMTHRMFDEAAWPMDGLHTTWGDLAVSLGVGVPMLRRTFTRMLQFAWFASEAPGGYGLRMTYPAPPRAAGRSRLVLDRITPGAVTA